MMACCSNHNIWLTGHNFNLHTNHITKYRMQKARNAFLVAKKISTHFPVTWKFLSNTFRVKFRIYLNSYLNIQIQIRKSWTLYRPNRVHVDDYGWRSHKMTMNQIVILWPNPNIQFLMLDFSNQRNTDRGECKMKLQFNSYLNKKE